MSDAIVVSNFSDAPLTFRVHGADLVGVAGGGVGPVEEGSASHFVGTWISVSQQELSVPAHQELNDPFTVTIPSGTGPGDHLGAVVVSKEAGAAQSIRVLTRAALIVKATVPGQVHLGVALGPLSADQQGSDERFSIAVHNAGNVLFTFTGEVTVRDGSRIVATVPVDPGGIYVIPGGSATVRATWHGTPELGEITAVASVHVEVNGAQSGTFVSNTLRLSFFSWRLLIVILLALLAIILALLAALLVRRRREACSHCGTKHRKSHLANVNEKAEVAMCPDCTRTVDKAGRAVLCTNCLKKHLLKAGRAVQVRRLARSHRGPAASGRDHPRARAEPPKQKKTAPTTSAARASTATEAKEDCSEGRRRTRAGRATEEEDASEVPGGTRGARATEAEEDGGEVTASARTRSDSRGLATGRELCGLQGL